MMRGLSYAAKNDLNFKRDFDIVKAAFKTDKISGTAGSDLPDDLICRIC